MAVIIAIAVLLIFSIPKKAHEAETVVISTAATTTDQVATTSVQEKIKVVYQKRTRWNNKRSTSSNSGKL